MAYEDLTTFTEVEETPGEFTVTSTRVSFSEFPNTETSYMYKSYGANHFAGNFTHDFTAYWSALSVDVVWYLWALGQDIGEILALRGANKNVLSALFVGFGGTASEFELLEQDGGSGYYIGTTSTYNTSTAYYPVVRRDEDVGAQGTLYLDVYSDSARQNLIETVSLTLHTSKKDYQYLYPVSTHDSGVGTSVTGYHENYDINEAAAGSPWYYYAQQ